MRDYADVVVKPPFLFGGALLLGSLLSWLIPFGPGLGSANGRALAAGGAFVVVGLALGLRAVWVLRRAGTTEQIGEGATKAMVESGPYRFTRNPIYIALTLIYFGLAIMLTSGWMLVLLVPVLTILQRGVVLREEAYLSEKFGEAYRKYQARVPRWL
jgi:protein-S-isoprenylcysteine O-methyltransferase Ste14